MEPEIHKTELKSEILNRITTEQICPRSKLFFRSRECFIWTLWFATVLLGAAAVALTFTAILIQQSDLYELTHDSWFEATLEAVPYLWLLVFVSMVVAAIYNLRYTKAGYRYPLWQIFSSSLVFSLAGGAALYLAGAGLVLDELLGRELAGYESQAKQAQKIWQQPANGRLVGQAATVPSDDVTTNQFVDVTGLVWRVNVSELSSADAELLQSGDKVRLLGELLGVDPLEFHACGVFRWLYEKDMSMTELKQVQIEMRQQLYGQLAAMDMVQNSDIQSRCVQHIKIRQLKARDNY